MGVPSGWTKSVIDPNVIDLNNPDGSGFIRLVTGGLPGGGVITGLQKGEVELSAQYGGYHRIRIEPMHYRNYPAGVWEFTFTGHDGSARHAEYMSFNVNDVNYAIYVSAPSDRFSAMVPVLDIAEKTFTLTS